MSSLETVTVLFTDLVGSTGLAARVGPAVAEGLRRDHFAILRGAVEATEGREVKNVGDGLMVVFQSCSNAVGCGVEMQQRLEHRNRRANEQFSVRVGISLGEANVHEGDYFGPPVVEAARLCKAAAGGQILCAEPVPAIAREGHRFRPVGALSLKGLPEALPAYEVEWQPALEPAGTLPLPPRLREVAPAGYVGRATEREGLLFLFDKAHEGIRRVAFISGEPGIGKTRLAAQLAIHAHGDGATVLYGRCDEDLGAPYGPWVRALRHYVLEASEDTLRAHAERHGGELARLVPEVRRRVQAYPGLRQTDPETERYLLYGAVASLLEHAAEERPVVLILDDLHWADAPSLSLLRHVVTQDVRLRLLVLAAYRDSDLAAGHPLAELLADLHREEGVSRIPLGGLEEADVFALMEAAAGHELTGEGRRLARSIVRETDGNPFFVGEILRHLLESGALVQGADGRFRLEGDIEDLGLPQSVREVVGRRVERLSEPTRRALGVAAVIGREFDVALLARVLETGDDELLDLLEEASAASVVDEASPVGRFSFSHALINHTLYETLSRTRRARLHGRIAEALEEVCGDDPGDRVAELAHHWGHAVTTDDSSKAVDYARRAGERALQKLAPAEAVRWFAQALELQADGAPGDRAARCDLLVGLGEAQRQVGDPAHRDTLLGASRLAEELGDADRAARAAFANHRDWAPSILGAVDEERLAALERAVELDGLRNPARSAQLISVQAVELMYDPDHERRWALADEALALARETRDDKTLASALLHHFPATVGRADFQAARARADELLDLAERLDDPALRLWAGQTDFGLRLRYGELEAANARLDRVQAIARELGQPVPRWFAAFVESSLRYAEGDLAASEHAAQDALEIGSDAAPADALLVYGGAIAPIRVAQGRSEEIVGMLEQAAANYPRMAAWQAGRAASYTDVGRTGEAAQIVAEAARRAFEDVHYDHLRPTALAYFAHAVFETGQREAAALLYEQLEPWADYLIWSYTGVLPQAATYLGMLAATLGQDELADEQLRSSCEFHERGGMPLFAAFGRVRWAETLARRGDGEAASRQAALALDMARRTRYVWVERRATALLESAASVNQPSAASSARN
jgi:class 3 adenylate cyclase